MGQVKSKDEEVYRIDKNYLPLVRELDIIEKKEELNNELWHKFDSVSNDIDVKTEQVMMVVSRLEAESAFLENEEKRLKARRDSRNAKIKFLKENLIRNLNALDLKRVETPSLTISVVKNPPKLVIKKESEIPKQYKEMKISYDLLKNDLKADLISGVDIPGAYIERGSHLRVS